MNKVDTFNGKPEVFSCKTYYGTISLNAIKEFCYFGWNNVREN